MRTFNQVVEDYEGRLVELQGRVQEDPTDQVLHDELQSVEAFVVVMRRIADVHGQGLR